MTDSSDNSLKLGQQSTTPDETTPEGREAALALMFDELRAAVEEERQRPPPDIFGLQFGTLDNFCDPRCKETLVPSQFKTAYSRRIKNPTSAFVREIRDALDGLTFTALRDDTSARPRMASHFLDIAMRMNRDYCLRPLEPFLYAWFRLAMLMGEPDAMIAWSLWFFNRLPHEFQRGDDGIGKEKLEGMVRATINSICTEATIRIDRYAPDDHDLRRRLARLLACLNAARAAFKDHPACAPDQSHLERIIATSRSLVDLCEYHAVLHPFLFEHVRLARSELPPPPDRSFLVCSGDLSFKKDEQHLKRFEALNSELNLIPLKDLEARESQLISEFPWHEQVIRDMSRDLYITAHYGRSIFRLRPQLLLGPTGSGKSRLAMRFAQVFEVPYRLLPLGGATDNRALAGTARGWSSATPSLILHAMVEGCCANPLIVLDEIDKSGNTGINGRAWDTLLAMTERQTSREWFDECLEANCDLSAVSFIGTANEVGLIPNTLLGRFQLHVCKNPTPEHLPVLMRGIKDDIAADFSLNPHWLDGIQVPESWSTAEKLPPVRQIKAYVEDELAKQARASPPARD
jgi:hypothetical protein